MGNVLQLIGGSVPKGLESPMKGRKATRITDIVRKDDNYGTVHFKICFSSGDREKKK